MAIRYHMFPTVGYWKFVGPVGALGGQIVEKRLVAVAVVVNSSLRPISCAWIVLSILQPVPWLPTP